MSLRFRVTLLALGSASVLAGCGTTVPPQLMTARLAYRDAVAGPATVNAPADLKSAEQALGRAERAFQEDGAGSNTDDLAYIAQRRAQIATAVANRQLAEQQKVRYAKERDEVSDEMRRDAVDDLKSAQQQLGRSEDQVAREQAARIAAESKTDKANVETAKARLETDKARAETEKEKARAEVMRATLIRAGQLAENERGVVITLNSGVLFRSGRSTVLPAAGRKLNEVAAVLRDSPERRISVEGHTDTDGEDANNLVLSQARADSVRAYLVSQGVMAQNMSATGFGESRPIATNTTIEGRANNRRVEIVLAPIPVAQP